MIDEFEVDTKIEQHFAEVLVHMTRKKNWKGVIVCAMELMEMEPKKKQNERPDPQHSV